jgi:hypothetical protein
VGGDRSGFNRNLELGFGNGRNGYHWKPAATIQHGFFYWDLISDKFLKSNITYGIELIKKYNL